MGSVFTAFPALIDRLGVEPRGLVHVGAHRGEEMLHYRAAGLADEAVTLVEPHPDLARRLRAAFPAARVVECACSDAPGEAVLHVTRRTNTSTLVAPHRRDRVTSRVTVAVRTLAAVQAAAPPANILVIDAQGLELAVLRGADLAGVDVAVVETCTVPDPSMASSYGDVSVFMAAAGFVEADRWVRDQDGVSQWARGRPHSTGGEIRDVVFTREA